VRREHDNESGDARHHGPGQRHGRSGNAGRIACIAAGLLAETRFDALAQSERASNASGSPILKCYLMVGVLREGYVFWRAAHRACPRGGVQIGRKEDGAPRLLPPD
jgi:hypothetical protein